MPPSKRALVKPPKKRPKDRAITPTELTEQAPTGLRDFGTGYVPALVTFLDILAFKELVTNKTPGEINNQLNVLLAFSQFGQHRRDIYARPELAPMVMQFSDSIIRIQPTPLVGGIEPYDLLIGEIKALTLLQGNLVCNGILIRGGLTFGQVCIRESRVFGPAFVRAYEIESKLARYPRILVDENLCTPLKSNPFSVQVSSSTRQTASVALSELLERNDDGQFAIQYLTHLFAAEHRDEITGLDVLKAHRDRIEGLLSQVLAPKLEEPRAKVRWAANYHNRWIDQSFRRLDEQEFAATGRGLTINIS